MASFPGSLASFIGFVTSHTLSVDNHAAQHNLEQAEILAVQTKVGTGVSSPIANTTLIGSGVGTSSWSQLNLTTMVSGVLPTNNGGTGTTSSTGTGSVVFATAPTMTAPTFSGGGSWSGSPTISTPVLTIPTISDFTSANHSHQTVSSGGMLTSASVNQTIAQVAAGGKFKIDSGTAAANASPDASIVFNTTFNTAPVVLLTASTVTTNNVYGIANTITTTGFKLRAFDAGGQKTTESFSWLALGT